MTFKKGQSGNPAGRPPKTGPGRDVELRRMLQAKAPELINQVLTMALAGDLAALKMALDRVLPAIKPVDQAVTIPIPGEDLVAAGQSILAAMASGQLTPEQGQRLAGVLELQRRLVETVELEQRISALEKKTK